jgi:hypothetical protein
LDRRVFFTPQPKDRSTVQLWGRRDTRKKRRSESDAELAEHDAKLKAELKSNQ